LADGGTYFVSVMAVDRAGNAVVVSSDGMVVDAMPPRVGAVRDGDSSRDASSQPLGPLAASWADFIDAGSGVARYEWAVGSAPCPTDVPDYSDVGLALRARMQSSAGLAAGR
jgi:hypothetical protein